MYLDNILIALYILIPIVIVLSTLTIILTFVIDYRDFAINFSRGILLKSIFLSDLNIILTSNKIQEFDSGIVKVMSETLFFVRRRLASETLFGINRRIPLVYSKVEMCSDRWVAEIRISWVSLVILLYPFLFFGFISTMFALSLINIHILFLIIFCAPFAIVYILYLLIGNEAINMMERIFSEFSIITY